MKRAGIGALAGLMALAGGLRAQSLRERIEAAKRAAEARGAAQLEARLEAASAEVADDVPFDPANHPYSWPVEDYDVPGRQSFGSYDRGGYEGRVYAEAPREVGERIAVGTAVALYEVPRRSDDFRLIGRAVVRKTRPKRGAMVVEAALLACAECERDTNKLVKTILSDEGLQAGDGPSFDPKVVTFVSSTSMLQEVSIMKFRRKSHPKLRTYYMSSRPLGPYTGWTDEQFRNFVRGQAWEGMPVEALIAMMGRPHMGTQADGGERYSWGTGPAMKIFVVRGGKVVDVELGIYGTD